MVRVSGLLIVKNEASFIEQALLSVLWCDEIVVVDAMSTDQTPEICLRVDAPWSSKIKFVQNEWIGFSAQRNVAIDLAKYEWVFFLDADERCSEALAIRLQEILKNEPSPAVFKVRRQEYFLRKPIHYGIWNPSFHMRFFPKQGVKFFKTVHEGIESTLPVKMVSEPILHNEDLRIERFLNKLNHYTTLQAQNDFERGMRTNLLRILLSFPAMFYKNYIYYRAYRDGHEGVIISILEGISRTVRHLKIWQLQKLKKPRFGTTSLTS
jgi:glycosyltransferase involved in cell wall biosynthesis